MRVQIWWCWWRGLVGAGGLRDAAARPRRRELLRKSRTLLRELEPATPLDVAELAGRIGEVRGKPIVVAPSEMPVDPGSGGESTGGAWLSSPNVDMIFVEQNTSALHQAHIVLHEIGHILADHPDQGGRDTVRDLLPDLPAELITRVLRRGHGYDDRAEKEAELIATQIATWADLIGQQPVKLSNSDHEHPLGRIQQALYERRGWQ